MFNISSNKPTLLFLATLTLLFACLSSEAKCRKGCDIALASYYLLEGSNLTYISRIFNSNAEEILRYNPQVTSSDNILSGTRINVPFSCDCLNADFLGHTFHYVTQSGDTYVKIAMFAFANLTTDYWIQMVNTYDPIKVPDFVPINVTVNCSCGDRHVSKDYGLFATYPVQVGESLESVANETGVPIHVIQEYNPGFSFITGSRIMFVPARGM